MLYRAGSRVPGNAVVNSRFLFCGFGVWRVVCLCVDVCVDINVRMRGCVRVRGCLCMWKQVNRWALLFAVLWCVAFLVILINLHCPHWLHNSITSNLLLALFWLYFFTTIPFVPRFCPCRPTLFRSYPLSLQTSLIALVPSHPQRLARLESSFAPMQLAPTLKKSPEHL